MVANNRRRFEKFISITLFTVSFSAVEISCVVSQSQQNVRSKDSEYNRSQNTSLLEVSDNKKSTIRIEGVRIFAWWWREADAKAGIDTVNPPPKDRYLEIQEWEYDGEGIKTYPHRIDVLSKVINGSSKAFQGTVVVKLSRKFEHLENIVDEKVDGIDKAKLDKLTWVEEEVIYSEKSKILANEAKEFKFQKFDLEKSLNQELDGKPLCALRFRVLILDESSNEIDTKEKELLVILGD